MRVPSSSSSKFFCRQRLLDVVRGIARDEKGNIITTTPTTTTTPQYYYYKCFPLQARHLECLNSQDSGQLTRSPQEFHRLLLDRIQNAQRRCYLASLYIGPAVDEQKYHAEAELLQTLRELARRSSASQNKKRRRSQISSDNGDDGNSNNSDNRHNSPQEGQHQVDIKILLDMNRALRPVPLPDANQQGETSLTSAEACYRALNHGDRDNDDNDRNNTANDTTTMTTTDNPNDHKSNNNNNSPPQIFLLSALRDVWQHVLPNPFNEAQGVFHIKAYIIDDTLILSGANLSEEYFTDRHDRYLVIQDGGNGLVDYYADLIQAVARHAPEYVGIENSNNSNSNSSSSSSKGLLLKAAKEDRYDLLRSIAKVVMTTDPSCSVDLDDSSKSNVVAVAVPTFQAPPNRFRHDGTLRSDVTAIAEMIQELGAQQQQPQHNANRIQNQIRVSSAYLNPTNTFLQACTELSHTHWLTAGRVSHGFKPKVNKAGNKGKDWIPTVFDELSRKLIAGSNQRSVWFYQRPDWTFHAKGLWCSTMRTAASPSSTSSDTTTRTADEHDSSFAIPETADLVAVTHGSGNFGARSEFRDFESNLVLLFPPNSPLAELHKQEWNEMGDYAAPSSEEPTKKLSFPFGTVLPWIKSFF